MVSTKPAIRYLCLQATREGQASHAHVHEIIQGLEARGWDVTLHQPDARRARPGLARRILGYVRAHWSLFASLRPRRDVVYCRSHVAAWPAMALVRLLRVPVVQEVNGPYTDLYAAWPSLRRARPLLDALMRAQLRWADRVITVSEELRAWIEGEAPDARVVVIPNGANTRLFRPDAKPPSDLPAPYVAFVGAFAPWQGLEVALEATRSPAWPADVTLVIAGDGPQRDAIARAAAEGAKVLHLGLIPYGRVPGVLAGSLAALSPKDGEQALYASPLKVFESLACGAPAIVSDYPGQAAPIQACRGGIVVPPGDAEALARAVATLRAAPEAARAMGARGHRFVLEAHSWDRAAARTHDVLEEMTRAPAGRTRAADEAALDAVDGRA